MQVIFARRRCSPLLQVLLLLLSIHVDSHVLKNEHVTDDLSNLGHGKELIE